MYYTVFHTKIIVLKTETLVDTHSSVSAGRSVNMSSGSSTSSLLEKFLRRVGAGGDSAKHDRQGLR